MTPLTIEAARARCAYWQERLRLRDWDVDLKIVRQSELQDGHVGKCFGSLTKRNATIQLLDPRDVDGQGWLRHDLAADWENTLVHELLHLHFWDLEHKPGSRRSNVEERAIDALSWALLEEQRGTHGARRQKRA